jgi:hypothetical protein
MKLAVVVAVAAISFTAAEQARAMCGCMLTPRPKVGQTATAKIVNKTSKVILARDGDTTVMTMANDFVGAPAEFGMVIPVPVAVKKDDVHIASDKVFDVLEAATAPGVTEIFEDDGCRRPMAEAAGAPSMEKASAAPAPRAMRASDYGVKVESHFFAGEYEIAVLSGKDASGLVTWLQKFNYDVPDDAKEVLESYIKQKMMFFLARVYVKEMGNERRHLRPIQVRYQTPKLMLPIRLGMVNADGPQELLVFTLTKAGRVESANYRTVKMPTASSLPWFVKNEWNDVYGAIFDEQEKREGNRVIFVEANRGLAVDDDVKKAGVFWPDNAFVTRMHFRYAQADFPEDLQLQSTADNGFFQVAMTAMKPAPSPCDRPAAQQRRSTEQATLANLTGWPMEKVLAKVGGGASTTSDPKWYDKLWK